MCPANDKTKTKEKLQDTNLKKNLSSVFFSLIQSQNISMWSFSVLLSHTLYLFFKKISYGQLCRS